MEQLKIENIELQTFDQWLSNMVDTFNYDMNQIVTAVAGLNMMLTNFDPAPTQYLKDALNKVIDDINEAFAVVSEKLSSLEERIKALEGRENAI